MLSIKYHALRARRHAFLGCYVLSTMHTVIAQSPNISQAKPQVASTCFGLSVLVLVRATFVTSFYATGWYRSYLAAFMLRVIDHALEHSNKAAARHFGDNFVSGTSNGSMHCWRPPTRRVRPSVGLRQKNVRKYRLHFSTTSMVSTHECAVLIEFIENKVCIVFRQESRRKISAWAMNGPHALWAKVYCLAEEIRLCDSGYPRHMKIRDFHRFVIRIQHEKNFLLSQIANVNEMLLNFDIPHSTTVKQRCAECAH